MMKNQANNYLASLESKLQLLAQGQEIGLSPEEAAIYGVDDADVHYPDLQQAVDDSFQGEPNAVDSIQLKF